MGFGVVSYKEKVVDTSIEVKTLFHSDLQKMRKNPTWVLYAELLTGRVKLSSEVADIAIFLNGMLSNNSFAISKGDGYITFVYQGSKEFLRNKFLLEIKIF